jgi:hypothetical protein
MSLFVIFQNFFTKISKISIFSQKWPFLPFLAIFENTPQKRDPIFGPFYPP